MTNNITDFPGITRLDIPPERILNRALEAKLCEVVVVGYTEEGREYFASSHADAADVAWLLQRGIFRLNQTCDSLEE
jgi:hypothetical protein